MIGGRIIGLARRPDGLATLNVQDQRYPGDTTVIRVREQRRDDGRPVSLSLGDTVWWQSRDVMWTPGDAPRPLPADRCGKDWDVRIPREGYSHSS